MTIDLHLARTSSDRVFELLDALASLGPGPHRLRDVAAHARLGASTAHRILQAGIRAGRVSKAQRGRYLLNSSDEPRSAKLPPPAPPEPAVPAGQPLVVSGRIRLALATLQKSTGQAVLLYVPLILDTPVRYCLAYFAPERDDLLCDAERLLASDLVFCAPLTVDAPGRLIMAHLTPRTAGGWARTVVGAGYTHGPSPVPGWHTLAVPLRRFGQIAGAICVTARASWLAQYRDEGLHQLLRLAREFGDGLPAEPPAAREGRQ